MTFRHPETGEILSHTFMPGETIPGPEDPVYMAVDPGTASSNVAFYDSEGKVIHLTDKKDEQDGQEVGSGSNQKGDGPEVGEGGHGGDAGGSEATGDGPSGGAPADSGGTTGGDATGAGPSGGAET